MNNNSVVYNYFFLINQLKKNLSSSFVSKSCSEILLFPQYFFVFEQVKFSLEAAKSALSNASIGTYDASAGMHFLRCYSNVC